MEQRVRAFREGETIFKMGDAGDLAYFIEKGRVEVLGPGGRSLGIVGENTIIGEMALIDPAPRMASAIARSDCSCRVITRQAFKDIIDDAPPLVAYLLRSMIRTQRHNVGVDIHAGQASGDEDGLGAEPPNVFQSHTKIIDRRSYAPGTLIFKEGSPGDAIYVVQTGEVEIHVSTGDETTKIVRCFGTGEVFGERALLQKTDRTAAAVARNSVVCAVLPADDFGRVLKQCSPILIGLIRIYVGTY